MNQLDDVTDPGRGGGWALTVVRHRGHNGRCGAELGAVYQNTSGLLLTGAGVIGSRQLDGSNRERVQMVCPKCGRPASEDPRVLRRAALRHQRSITIE